MDSNLVALLVSVLFAILARFSAPNTIMLKGKASQLNALISEVTKAWEDKTLIGLLNAFRRQKIRLHIRADPFRHRNKRVHQRRRRSDKSEIGSFTEPMPRRIKRLSALSAAKDMLNRPDVAVDFSAGDFRETQNKQELIAVIEREIEKNFRYYQTGLRRV